MFAIPKPIKKKVSVPVSDQNEITTKTTTPVTTTTETPSPISNATSSASETTTTTTKTTITTTATATTTKEPQSSFPDFPTPIPKDTSKSDSQKPSPSSPSTSSTESIGKVEKDSQPLLPESRQRTTGLPVCSYKEPSWADLPSFECSLEIIKNGTIIDDVSLCEKGKNHYVIGRLPSNDIMLEHQSISRFHAVIQHRDNTGVYLYDLGSTHGTRLNKQTLKPHTYYRIRAGYVMTFGMSSRVFVFHTPEDIAEQDQEDLKQLQIQKVINDHVEKEKQRKEEEGCAWGFKDDAQEDSDDGDNINNSAASDAALMMSAGFMNDGNQKKRKWMKDPKNTLTKYFENEGTDLNFEFVDGGTRRDKTFIVKLKLPIHQEQGQIVAEGEARRKKDAIHNCCYDACRKMQFYGLFSGKKSVRKSQQVDSDSSDDDEYLNRTGEVQKKLALKAQKLAEKNEVLTHEGLSKKIEELEIKERDILQNIKEINDDMESSKANDEDELDAYMSKMKKDVKRKKKLGLEKELKGIREEKAKRQKMLNLTSTTVSVVKASKSLFSLKSSSTSKTLIDNEKEVVSLTTTTLESQEEEEEEVDDGKTQADASEENTTGTKRSSVEVNNDDQLQNLTSVDQNNTATSKSQDNKIDDDDTISFSAKRKKENLEEQGGIIFKPKKGPVQKPAASAPVPVEYVSKPNKNMCLPSFMQKNEDEVWTPPEGQTGDGKTSLNAKYGY